MFPSSVALRCHIQIFLRQTRCVMNANVPVFSQNVSGWFLFCAEKNSFTILPFITQSPRGFLIFMLCYALDSLIIVWEEEGLLF